MNLYYRMSLAPFVLSGRVLWLLMGFALVVHAYVAYAGSLKEEVEKCNNLEVAGRDRIDCLTRLTIKEKFPEILKRAEEGHAISQYILGRAYEKGDLGIPQDVNESMRWYREAAIQGLGAAQTELGMMYFKGQAVARSYKDAFTWLKPAAEQGEPLAQVTMGTMYEAGDGVPQDFVQAHMWFNLAAASFSDTRNPNFAVSREVATMARGLVAGRMTPDQIAEVQKMAREWRPKKSKE